MAEESNDISKPASGILSALAWVAVLVLFLVFGTIFVRVTVPAMYFATSGRTFESPKAFVRAIADAGTAVAKLARGEGATEKIQISDLASLPFIVIGGWFCQQICGTIAALLTGLSNRNRKKSIKLFNFGMYLNREYGDFKTWLLRQQSYRLEWEWELCNYYIYWFIFQSLLFVTVSAIMTVSFSLGWCLPAIVACGFSLMHALGRSESMAFVHKACLDAFRKHQNSATSGPRTPQMST